MERWHIMQETAMVETTKKSNNSPNIPQIVHIICMDYKMHTVPIEVAMQMGTLKDDIVNILKKGNFADNEMAIIKDLDKTGVKLCSIWVSNNIYGDNTDEWECEFAGINRQKQMRIVQTADALNMVELYHSFDAATIKLYRQIFKNEHSSDESDYSDYSEDSDESLVERHSSLDNYIQRATNYIIREMVCTFVGIIYLIVGLCKLFKI